MVEEKQENRKKRIDVKEIKPQLGKMPFNTLYSDYTRLQYNFAGFKFTFNVVCDSKEEGVPVLEPQVAVCLSAEHALQVFDVLSGLLGKYQKKYGAIRSEPHLEETLEKPKS